MSDPVSTVGNPNQALPGPHPHESADFEKWAGSDGTGQATRGLPPGVEPYRPPTAEEETPDGYV